MNQETFETLLKEVDKIKEEPVQKVLRSILIEISQTDIKEDLPQKAILEEITRIMLYVGMPAELMGFQYVRDAIMENVMDNRAIKGITNTLYPKIAEKYKTTPSIVERSIRYAIEEAWLRGKPIFYSEIFGNTVSINQGRPTNSAFIATISDKVRMKFNI